MNILDTLQPPGASIPLDPAAGATLLDNLPGHILSPHARYFANLYFLSFTDRALGRAWLRSVGAQITTASVQLAQAAEYDRTGTDGGLFVGLYLTAAGATLTSCMGSIPGDASFRAGARAQAGAIGDGTANNPLQDWVKDYKPSPDQIHAVLQLAFDIPGTETAFLQQWVDNRNDVTLRILEKGGRFTDRAGNNLEHFGFVDGISRMRYLTSTKAGTNNNRPVADTNYRLSHVLRCLPDDDQACGSFLVFRKLEQDVDLFRQQVSGLTGAPAGAVTMAQVNLAGATVIGRFPDGTPLAMQGTDGLGPEDDFTFGAPVMDEGEASGGGRCPFRSHIRKMNPRGDSRDKQTDAAKDRNDLVKNRQPTRRSITYGERKLIRVNDDLPRVLAGDLPAEPVGVLFMAFVSNITEQFEHLMLAWANRRDFPYANSGMDPLIGRTQGSKIVSMDWPRGSDLVNFESCVKARGGVYCFAPPRSFFQKL